MDSKPQALSTACRRGSPILHDGRRTLSRQTKKQNPKAEQNGKKNKDFSAESSHSFDSLSLRRGKIGIGHRGEGRGRETRAEEEGLGTPWGRKPCNLLAQAGRNVLVNRTDLVLADLLKSFAPDESGGQSRKRGTGGRGRRLRWGAACLRVRRL